MVPTLPWPGLPHLHPHRTPWPSSLHPLLPYSYTLLPGLRGDLAREASRLAAASLQSPPWLLLPLPHPLSLPVQTSRPALPALADCTPPSALAVHLCRVPPCEAPALSARPHLWRTPHPGDSSPGAGDSSGQGQGPSLPPLLPLPTPAEAQMAEPGMGACPGPCLTLPAPGCVELGAASSFFLV